MRVRNVMAVIIVAGLTSLTIGCSSKAETKVEARTTTVGQELTDLEKARDSGVITEKEYQEQRAAVLERNKK